VKSLAITAALLLSSCSSGNLLDEKEGAPAFGVVMGQANVIGGELLLGPYRPGIAFTFRYVAPVDAVPAPVKETPIVYPSSK